MIICLNADMRLEKSTIAITTDPNSILRTSEVKTHEVTDINMEESL